MKIEELRFYQYMVLILSIVFISLMASCVVERDTCVSCHTDKELLQEIAEPIDYPEESGEG